MSKQKSQKLLDAMSGDRLIRFRRRFENEVVRGYVVGVGPKFFLLQLVSDRIRYDGFECIRIKDVRRPQPDPYISFVKTALGIRTPERPARPEIDLSGTEAMIASAGALFPLITLHRETEDPDVCWIGRLVSVDKRRVQIRTIDPNAEWEPDIDSYDLKEITLVNFGGDYETALQMVGGDPPE